MEAPPPRRVTPKTASTSERSRPPPASAAPAERRAPGAGVGLGAPGPSGGGGDAAEHGSRLPGARLHAEAQPPQPGHSPPRPRTQEAAGPGPPTPFLRVPASRSQVTRRRPRPAPPLCAALRFPQPRLRGGEVTSRPPPPRPRHGSTLVSARTQVEATRKGGSPADWRKGEGRGGGGGTSTLISKKEELRPWRPRLRATGRAGRTTRSRLVNIDSTMHYRLPMTRVPSAPHTTAWRVGAPEASRSGNLSGRMDSLTSRHSSLVSSP
ncbi:uncharacterized protein LOC128776457 [Panthera pardus]|uniref:Uncharacterized protein LOC128776457 n=1 Tax=Panthera pardus TaxID=9691 RepID=A0A9W2VDM0_PANPR|nr:uncharacterized protein LOC128776457 [Panthera pardus]